MPVISNLRQSGSEAAKDQKSATQLLSPLLTLMDNTLARAKVSTGMAMYLRVYVLSNVCQEAWGEIDADDLP